MPSRARSSITYPPEMLPKPDGPADVIVCANHPGCPLADPMEKVRLTSVTLMKQIQLTFYWQSRAERAEAKLADLQKPTV